MDCTRRQLTKHALLAGAACTCWAASLFSAEGKVHRVQKGETLSGISIRYGVTITALRQANKITGDLIRIGQKLIIPAPRLPQATRMAATQSHIVRRGETLSGIALQYGTSVSRIKEANSLRSDTIRTGQRLLLPAGHRSGADYLTAVRAATSGVKVRRDNWERIVVHHSGLKHGNAEKYDAGHRRRGMQNGLAYHFVIGNGIDSGDGEIEVGPRWHRQLLGGHVKSYRINLTAIGICLVGNFDETYPSRRQIEAFTQLMDWLRGDIIPDARHFAGHRELKGEHTICPGKHFPLAAMHRRYG